MPTRITLNDNETPEDLYASWTKDERSLLLFLETVTVDHAGRVDLRRMNDEDIRIAKEWNEAGYINFGRIKVSDHNRQGTNWVQLGPTMRLHAATMRALRAEAGWNKRHYRTSREPRPLHELK